MLSAGLSSGYRRQSVSRWASGRLPYFRNVVVLAAAVSSGVSCAFRVCLSVGSWQLNRLSAPGLGCTEIGNLSG